jgi:Na+-driven multidrug efflux pump
VRERILSEPLARLCLRLATPAVALSLLHGLNLLVDIAWAGHLLGTDAVAALGVVFSLNHLVVAFEALVAVGASTLLSRALGADDADAERRIYRAASLLCLVLGAVLIVLGYAFAPPLMRLLGLDGASLQLGRDFYLLYLAGTPLVLYAFTSSSLLQGHGALGRMAAMAAAGIACNALLTPLLIHAGLGIRAVALGTLAGQLLVCIGNRHWLARRSGFSLSPLGAGGATLRSMASIGQSGALLQGVYFVQGLLVFSAVARWGDTTDTAIMGAAYRVILLAVYFATGFSRALQPVLGMSLGAGDSGRAWRAFGVFNALAALAIVPCWLVLVLAPHAILHAILPGIAPDASRLADLRLDFAIVPLIPFLLTSLVFLQNAGHAHWVSVLGLVRLLVLLLPAIAWLPQWLGLTGVYAALALTDAALVPIVFALGWRLRNRLTDHVPVTVVRRPQASC